MASISVKVADKDVQSLDRRADARTEINRIAVLRLADLAYNISVADLTRDGCKISTDAELEIGDTVTLGFAGVGQTIAEIVWREGDIYGCMFENPLPSGAVTAATLNNVGNLGDRQVSRPVEPGDVKWHRGHQLAFVVGASAVLWAGLISVAVILF